VACWKSTIDWDMDSRRPPSSLFGRSVPCDTLMHLPSIRWRGSNEQ